MLYGAVLAALMLMLAAPGAIAESIYWDNLAGGDFNVADNWFPKTVPGPDDDVIFAADDASYRVDILDDRTNRTLTVHDDDVTLDLGDHLYQLGGTSQLSRSLRVGRIAGTNAALTITNGTLESTDGFIGRYGSTGTLTVETDATYRTGHLNVGQYGNGTLRIEGGGEVATNSTTIGSGDSGSGSVVVTEPDSTWNAGGLEIGFSGNNSVRVDSGGQINSGRTTIGTARDASGAVTITGSDSTWTISGYFQVGRFGDGTLRIEEGGEVSSQDVQIGARSGSAGNVTVTGIGSSWINGDTLYVGGEAGGLGTLNIGLGGFVLAGTGTSDDGYTQYSTGTLHYHFDRFNNSQGVLRVLGDMDLAGTLDIDFIDGYSGRLGQSFDIFGYTGTLTGTFDEILLPRLSEGLAWNRSELYTSGRLSVAAEPTVVPTPAALPAGLIGLGLLAAMKRPVRRRGTKTTG